MSRDDAPKPKPLRDEEIVSTKKISRRSLLASTGIGIGAAALVAAGIKNAQAASDAKTLDMDRPPPTSDPDKD